MNQLPFSFQSRCQRAAALIDGALESGQLDPASIEQLTFAKCQLALAAKDSSIIHSGHNTSRGDSLTTADRCGED